MVSPMFDAFAGRLSDGPLVLSRVSLPGSKFHNRSVGFLYLRGLSGQSLRPCLCLEGGRQVLQPIFWPGCLLESQSIMSSADSVSAEAFRTFVLAGSAGPVLDGPETLGDVLAK